MTQAEKAILVVVGPTASGKTRLGVELAKTFHGEVVSADSMQIYQGMDIGTAKPTPQEMEGIPHHMLDIIPPGDHFSVAKYVEQASQIIADIQARGKRPILVGGTGLYIDSLISGRAFAPFPQDRALRSQLEAEIQEKGGEALLARLRAQDPATGNRLFPNDHKRIIRGLEIFALTGQTQSHFDAETKKIPPRYQALYLGLNFAQREDLRQRIYSRVDQMMAQGLLDEVASFLHLPPETTAMQAIGYKELRGVLTGALSQEEGVELLKLRSRQYAKRQITWFRRNPQIHWHNWEKFPDFQAALQESTNFLVAHGVK